MRGHQFVTDGGDIFIKKIKKDSRHCLTGPCALFREADDDEMLRAIIFRWIRRQVLKKGKLMLGTEYDLREPNQCPML